MHADALASSIIFEESSAGERNKAQDGPAMHGDGHDRSGSTGAGVRSSQFQVAKLKSNQLAAIIAMICRDCEKVGRQLCPFNPAEYV